MSKIPIDPNNIKDGTGFVTQLTGKEGYQVDSNEMIVGQWYYFYYKGDKYLMLKDKNGSVNIGSDNIRYGEID